MADASGDDIAVLLLRLMPPEMTDMILGRLGPDIAARLRTRLGAAAGSPAGAEIDGALAHFFDLQRIVERPAPAPAAPPGPPPEVAPVDELRSFPPEILAKALDGEQPGTIALILSCLDPGPAGKVMQRMDLDLRAEVALRLSKLGVRNQSLLDKLTAAVAVKARRLGQQPPEPSADELIKNLADMLRAIPRAERFPVVKKIELVDPDLAAKIIEQLYRLEDLLRIPDRQIQTLLGKLDVKTLAIALKGVDPEIVQKVSSNMSSRSREVLGDESALLGTVPNVRVKEAQKKVIGVIRKAEEEGEITPEE